MVRVSGRLLDFVEDPSNVAQVRVRAREVRPHGDGVMLDHPVTVEWDPESGVVSFDAPASAMGVIMWHAVGRSNASGSLPIIVPDADSASLADCVRNAEMAGERDASELAGILEQIRASVGGAAEARAGAEAAAEGAAGSAVSAGRDAARAEVAAGEAATEAAGLAADAVRLEVKEDADRSAAGATTATEKAAEAAGSATRAETAEAGAVKAEEGAVAGQELSEDAAAVAVAAAVGAAEASSDKADTTYVDAADQALGQRITDEKWNRGGLPVDDLNNLTTPGTYRVDRSVANRPSTSNGSVEVALSASSGLLQRYVEGGSSPRTYVRTQISAGSAWSDWARADSPWQHGPLGTTHLDTVTTPGWHRQHLYGNVSVDRGYPDGALQGVLQVMMLGTGMTHQTYSSKNGLWVRRSSGGEFNEPWVAIGSGDLPARVDSIEQRVETVEQGATGQLTPTVGTTGAVTTYGRTMPDPWLTPNKDTFWNGPNGTRFFPSGYPGSGYVGAIGTSAGYTNMVVEKGESDNIYVSAVNPTTGRHVTWMVEGKGGDDMPIVGGIWIGGMTAEGRASRDTQLTSRSNMEYAIRINVDGVEQYVPWHGDNTAIAAAPTVFTDSSGNIIDMDSQPYRTALTGFDGFKVHQEMWARHPSTGDRNLAKIDQVSTFSPDGLFRSETYLTVLETFRIEGMSIGNAPINAGVADTFHVWGGDSHTLPGDTGSYQEVLLPEAEKFGSGMFTGPNGIFAAVSLLDPESTRADTASWMQSPGRRWIQIRPGGFTKFYQRSVGAGQDLPAGLSWAFGAEWRYGENPEAVNLTQSTVAGLAD